MERHALRDGMSTRGHKKRGAFDGWTTISIKRRYGVDKTTVQTEEWSIKMAHNGVGIWSAPSLRDHYWILLPGHWVQSGEFLGNVVRNKELEQLCLDGPSVGKLISHLSAQRNAIIHYRRRRASRAAMGDECTSITLP